MSNLSSPARSKREAWATRGGTRTYIQEMGRYALHRDEKIVRRMLGTGPGKLLDVPCGTGRFLNVEKELGFTVIAADYSPTMLSTALEHGNVGFLRADVFAPPFAPESFDVILVLRLLFHYADPMSIIRSLAESLKPGGRIIFDTLNSYSTRWAASQVLHRLRPDPARRLHFKRPCDIERETAAVNLKVVERESAYLLPTRAYRYLPRLSWPCLETAEALVPANMRVLTYWHVCKE